MDPRKYIREKTRARRALRRLRRDWDHLTPEERAALAGFVYGAYRAGILTRRDLPLGADDPVFYGHRPLAVFRREMAAVYEAPPGGDIPRGWRRLLWVLGHNTVTEAINERRVPSDA